LLASYSAISFGFERIGFLITSSVEETPAMKPTLVALDLHQLDLAAS